MCLNSTLNIWILPIMQSPTAPETAPSSPNLNQLAHRFLDLWQEQVALWLSDPALAKESGQLLASLWSGHFDGSATTPGAAPAGLASQLGGSGSAQLEHRLAALEERLAALESRLGSGGGSAAD